MRITFVHPAIGHRAGQAYIRSWQMEPLPIATLAGLTPADIEVRFFDDRMEPIGFDEPTDAVAIPVETYTAYRAYQIASEYRRRGVPVILGGFHPTLMPDEALRFGECVVSGEAEGIWPEVLDDLRHRRLKRQYRGERVDLAAVNVDRSVFRGKRYLPIGLIETGRGCRFPCEFCAIQTFFARSYRSRPVSAVVGELESLRDAKKLFFFVDDNFAGNIEDRKELLSALETIDVRWVTQLSINAAHDEDFVARLARAGCRGVLIGFESLNEANLRLMHKQFNTMKGGFTPALRNLARHGLKVYGTFIFGYDHDGPDSFDAAVDFAIEHRMYIAAFNHITPFPGTTLYQRLQAEGRLRFPAWWLDQRYRYNDLPFVPRQMSPEAVTHGCVQARRRFYSWSSILRRSAGNRGDAFMFRNYFLINQMHRSEISVRNGYPLGDMSALTPLLEVA